MHVDVCELFVLESARLFRQGWSCWLEQICYVHQARVFAGVSREYLTVSRNIFKNLVPTPQRTLALFTADINHVMICLFWEPYGARELCVDRMRTFFEAETGDTYNYQRWSGRPIPGRDQTCIFFPTTRPDRFWGLAIPHSVCSQSFLI